MPWEVRFVADGSTVFVDDEPYVVVARAERAGQNLCPPYLLLTGPRPPRWNLGVERVQNGTLSTDEAWWVSHCAVDWDGPEIRTDVRRPGSAVARTSSRSPRGTGG